jgi:TIR domain/NACHT domain
MTLPSVFISYSHKDGKWMRLFVQHLASLEREKRLTVWSDAKLAAGVEWFDEIEKALKNAKVAILLLSVDFLTSDFILNEEVPRLLRRRAQDGLHLVPVILRTCPWQEVGWLQPLLIRPLGAKTLASFRGKEAQEVEVVKVVKEVLSLVGGATQVPGEFLAAYRRAFSALYSRWNLASVGVPPPMGAGSPIEARLDEMYLPLRLAKEYDIQRTSEGAPLSPAELLKRERPLMVRGAAGTGKTTWMRWTFRQLLDPKFEALPIMLVLRDIAVLWKDRARQDERSLDDFLKTWVAQYLPGRETLFAEYLVRSSSPRPVLLVDGWDEVGPLSDELREKLLGFLDRHPYAMAVVTGRPYGEGSPSQSEGFEVLDIQPLSDGEIGNFVERFFARCHGEDKVAAARNSESFKRALERAPEPQALARTPLLLTMMLLITRSRSLPAKRHLLYQACVENLLTALPDRKEDEGALMPHQQWRPPDSEERMQLVAGLAFRLQTGDERSSGDRSSPTVRSWEAMSTLLQGVPEFRRDGFLAWLAGPAGLLTARANDTLAFTHLSFQDYLSAWYLYANVEEGRIEAFLERLDTRDWWETLRLWAALLQRQNPVKLKPVLEALCTQSGAGLALAGCLFADGLGTTAQFQGWLSRLGDEIWQQWPEWFRLCQQAWVASSQEERRSLFSGSLAAIASQGTWLSWLRCAEVKKDASLVVELPLPTGVLHRAVIQREVEANEPALVAASRLWSGGVALSPARPLELGLLQVWPSKRLVAGARLQLAASFGASRQDLRKLAAVFLKPHQTSYLQTKRAREWIFDVATYLMRPSAGDAALDWANYLVRTSDRELASDLAQNLARASGLSFESSPWLGSFAIVDSLSCGRNGARAAVAAGSFDEPEALLLSAACRSIYGTSDNFLAEALDCYGSRVAPLWLALARHLVRRSSREDRLLLINSARYPEKMQEPLQWGLQFIVRGDVLLEDNSVVTLDTLAEEAGLPLLTLLDDAQH